MKKLLFIIILFTLLIIGYKKLESTDIKINDKEFSSIIINNTYKDSNIIKDTLSFVLDEEEKEVIEKEEVSPIIYLYNTHQSEEYKYSDFIEFSITPTVMMNDYILEDIFNKNNLKTIVEERSIKDILNNNNWNYAASYKASRIYMEDIIVKYPSLKYFIDIHRDSVDKDITTTIIDNKSYAKILFIVGLENPNYNSNLEFSEKINKKLDELYPGLSRGIYKKEGKGVNGIYNQDFSKYTILIEVGGYQNTTNEVLNSLIAFSKCFMEIINEENN